MSWLKNTDLTVVTRPYPCVLCRGPVLVIFDKGDGVIGSPCLCSDRIDYEAATRLHRRP